MPPGGCSGVIVPNTHFRRYANVRRLHNEMIDLTSFKFVTFIFERNLFRMTFAPIESHMNVGVSAGAAHVARRHLYFPRCFYN